MMRKRHFHWLKIREGPFKMLLAQVLIKPVGLGGRHHRGEHTHAVQSE